MTSAKRNVISDENHLVFIIDYEYKKYANVYQ